MNTNKETYVRTFMELLGVDEGTLLGGLSYQGVESWDSVGHMALMAELEDVFSIELDIDDIIDFSSFSIGIEILKKYGVAFDE